MSRTSSSRLRTLGAELVIVFLGVMIALAADSWRERLGEKSLASSYLVALEGEMEEAASAAIAARSDLEARLSRNRDFLTLVRSSEELVDSLLAPGMAAPDLVIPTGTLEALVATGDLNLFEDDALRVQIVATLAGLREGQVAYRQQMARGATDYSGWLDVAELIRFEDGLVGGRLRASSIQARPEAIAAYQRVQNTQQNLLKAVQRMEAEIGRLQGAIRGAR